MCLICYNSYGDDMKFEINYQNNTKARVPGYKALVNDITSATLKHLKKKGSYEISLTIVNDKTIHKYNKEYRGVDRPTDVISFAFNDSDDGIVLDKNMPNVLGDIIISIDTAKRQAVSYGHSLKRELSFLYVHGLLHLLGYDHMKPKDEKIMFALQDEILNKLGIYRKD